MKVAVYNTYVIKKDGAVMHFDILLPDKVNDEAIIHQYGNAYLKSKGQESQSLSSKECKFCHIEQASEKMIADINTKGYSIIEMEGCNV